MEKVELCPGSDRPGCLLEPSLFRASQAPRQSLPDFPVIAVEPPDFFSHKQAFFDEPEVDRAEGERFESVIGKTPG
jgi:hypothetical protein